MKPGDIIVIPSPETFTPGHPPVLEARGDPGHEQHDEKPDQLLEEKARRRDLIETNPQVAGEEGDEPLGEGWMGSVRESRRLKLSVSDDVVLLSKSNAAIHRLTPPPA